MSSQFAPDAGSSRPSPDQRPFYGTLLREGRRDGRGGLSRKSVRNVHMVLRRALADAVRWDRLVRNPADLADPPPARRGDAPTMKTWTAAELRRFLAHVEGDRLYGAWVVAATTGMRRGEVLALRWRDVDLSLGRLSISQQVTTLGNRPVVSSPKTAKSRRLVALDPATVEALRAHRVAQAEERLLMGPGYRDEDLVFAWPDGRPVHPDLFSQWFDRHVQAAGLAAHPPARLAPHPCDAAPVWPPASTPRSSRSGSVTRPSPSRSTRTPT